MIVREKKLAVEEYWARVEEKVKQGALGSPTRPVKESGVPKEPNCTDGMFSPMQNKMAYKGFQARTTREIQGEDFAEVYTGMERDKAKMA